MRRLVSKLCLIPILTLFVAVACDPGNPTAVELESSQPDPLLGSVGDGDPLVGYTLLKDPLLPENTSLSESKLIAQGGGSVTVLGHTLTVPIGAVSQPTLFTVEVLPTGYVEVDLKATTASLLHGLIDVGSNGFDKPVQVSLTYSRATNVDQASQLQVLHLHGMTGYTTYTVLPSQVNTVSKTVSAELDHFSRYTLAYPE